MKKFALLLLLALQTLAFSQKHDYIWLGGYDAGFPTPGEYGNFKIDFNAVPAESTEINTSAELDFTSVQMADKFGKLQFYSEGCSIFTANHETMENGDSINYGAVWQPYCNQIAGYIIPQGAIALPWPGTENKYVMIHQRYGANIPDENALLYTVVDMNASGGKGRVVSKNQVLVKQDHIVSADACRHANGRDWWILTFHQYEAKYYRFLLTPEGFEGPWVQEMPSKPIHPPGSPGFWYWHFFSPMGDRYVEFDGPRGINYYEFDRCSGLLENPVFTNYFPSGKPNANLISGSFSSNGRFLYVDDNIYPPGQLVQCHLVQYDTYQNEWWLHGDTVGVYDGTLFGNNASYFFVMQLGPDDKIYINAGATKLLHQIEYPDLPGTACGFRQRGVELPVRNTHTLPHIPNYRLYDLPGSACDTLGIDGPVSEHETAQTSEGLLLSPNPSPGVFHLTHVDAWWQDARLSVTDMTGRNILKTTLNGRATAIDLGHYPSGLYHFLVQGRGGKSWSGVGVLAR